MKGKPKTIPSRARERGSMGESRQIPVPYDQNRASKNASQAKEASDAPTDENFVNDDIIEENSHVIPPTKKTTGKQGSKSKSSSL